MKIVRTEHLNESIQERHRVVILDNQEEKAHVEDVIFSDKFFGKFGKSIKIVNVDIIR